MERIRNEVIERTAERPRSDSLSLSRGEMVKNIIRRMEVYG